MTYATPSVNFGARLRSTLASLLLALLNATLLLFVLAAVLGIVLVGKVRTLASDVAADATQAAIGTVGLNPADTLAELRIVAGEMHDLRIAIEERRGDLDAPAAALAARLEGIEATIETLRERKLALTDAAIERATVAAGAALTALRDCRGSGAGS